MAALTQKGFRPLALSRPTLCTKAPVKRTRLVEPYGRSFHGVVAADQS